MPRDLCSLVGPHARFQTWRGYDARGLNALRVTAVIEAVTISDIHGDGWQHGELGGGGAFTFFGSVPFTVDTCVQTGVRMHAVSWCYRIRQFGVAASRDVRRWF